MIWLDANTTFTPDTPQDWAHFHRLKREFMAKYGLDKQSRKGHTTHHRKRRPVLLFGYNTCK